ncbi:MAG: threonine dehydratase [Deltaproteobacteria bacterium]|nr:threonine dehydratase [Deltaproteobacteria bacterium]
MSGAATGWALGELEAAAAIVHEVFAPTPAIAWPLLAARCGTDVVVKHENHLPTGAFKVRGGLLYTRELAAREPAVHTLVAATRGNHGQSVAFAARRAGLAARIVVPHGNSATKNAAMRAYGATLVEHGRDFQEALEHARELGRAPGHHFVPSFQRTLVAGVASWALELFAQAGPLDRLYVPIGLGSGICGAIAVRDALGLATGIVGVVAEKAPSYALSFAQGEPVEAAPADTLADGLAVRLPDADALAVIRRGAERVVTVGEDEIRAAMRHYFTDTHNVAEGAGAAPLAALLQERGGARDPRERAGARDPRVGLVLTGGNVDAALYAEVLQAG